MLIASTLFVSLAASASAAGAQTETVSASATSRVVVKTGRIPVKVADGRAGWVQFDLSGEAGGRVSGRFTLMLRAGDTPATMTEYMIMGGGWIPNETDYDFLTHGILRTAGGASRPFSSRLTVKRAGSSTGTRAPNGLQNEDSWSVQEAADRGVTVHGGLACQMSGTDMRCTS